MARKEDLISMITVIEQNKNYELVLTWQSGMELATLRDKLVNELNKILKDEEGKTIPKNKEE